MVIKNMTADFGVLERQTLELSEGLNILYAPNESGKSSWCAFLRAMLYGLDTSRRARGGQQPDKVRYKPWSGRPMAGRMEVALPAGSVTLTRGTERDDRPMQAFAATVTGTETPAGYEAETVGETLTGMNEAVFDRTAFIRQSALAVANDPALDRRINALVSAGDESLSSLEVEERLRRWQRHRAGRSGAIPALEAELAETRQTLEALRAKREEAAALEETIARRETELAEARQRTQRARAERRKQAMAAFAAARRQAEEAEDARQAAERAFQKADAALEAPPFRRMPPEEATRRAELDADAAEELTGMAARIPPVWYAFLPLGLALIAFLLAALLPWTMGCAIAGCVLALLFVVMFTRLQSLANTKRDTLAKRDRILAHYGVAEIGDIRPMAARYRALWRERDRAEIRLEEATRRAEAAERGKREAEAASVASLDFTHGDDVVTGRAEERLGEELALLRERRARLEGEGRALGDAAALESELLEGERRLALLHEQERAIALALEALGEADTELRQRVSPRLAQAALALFSRLTGGRYEAIAFGRDLSATAQPAGDTLPRPLDSLSSGAKDQLYLALRLAVCQLLPAPEAGPCPIVLDDALIAFDTPRMERALDLLRELADSRQILLFTCHEREGAYFAGDDTVTKRTISS